MISWLGVRGLANSPKKKAQERRVHALLLGPVRKAAFQLPGRDPIVIRL